MATNKKIPHKKNRPPKRTGGQRGSGKGKRSDAGKPKDVPRPRNWDKACLLAYYRLIGSTQIQAALATGVSERSVGNWESATWWHEAQRDGRKKYFRDLEGHAMRTILQSFAVDAEKFTSAKWVADRIISELSPPRQRIEHDIDAKVQAKADVVIYMPDNGRDKKDG